MNKMIVPFIGKVSLLLAFTVELHVQFYFSILFFQHQSLQSFKCSYSLHFSLIVHTELANNY